MICRCNYFWCNNLQFNRKWVKSSLGAIIFGCNVRIIYGCIIGCTTLERCNFWVQSFMGAKIYYVKISFECIVWVHNFLVQSCGTILGALNFKCTHLRVHSYIGAIIIGFNNLRVQFLSNVYKVKNPWVQMSCTQLNDVKSWDLLLYRRLDRLRGSRMLRKSRL